MYTKLKIIKKEIKAQVRLQVLSEKSFASLSLRFIYLTFLSGTFHKTQLRRCSTLDAM